MQDNNYRCVAVMERSGINGHVHYYFIEDIPSNLPIEEKLLNIDGIKYLAIEDYVDSIFL